MCLISLYVTATVTTSADLPHATAWIEAGRRALEIRLRRMAYSQAAGFAATLPCGIRPPSSPAASPTTAGGKKP